MAKRLNEKTLEINVCAELTNYFRLFGFQSVWRGLSQHEEKRWGFDGATQLPNGRLIFFQWKASKGISQRGGGYKFMLDDEQMKRLVRLAKRYPQAVYYGLPQVADWGDFRKQGFHALPETRFLEVGQLQGHPSLGQQGSHTATIINNGSQVRVTSKPKEYSALRIDTLFGDERINPLVLDLFLRQSGVPASQEEGRVFNFMMLNSKAAQGPFAAHRKSILDKLPSLTTENLKSFISEELLGGRLTSHGFCVGLLLDQMPQVETE